MFTIPPAKFFREFQICHYTKLLLQANTEAAIKHIETTLKNFKNQANEFRN